MVNAPEKIKKIETKFMLTEEVKTKLKFLSYKTKLNQSELIESMILNYEDEQNLYSNVQYIKSRERVLFEIATLAEELKKQHSMFQDQNHSLDEKFKKSEKVIGNYLTEHTLKITQSYHNLTQKISKYEELITKLQQKF